MVRQKIEETGQIRDEAVVIEMKEMIRDRKKKRRRNIFLVFFLVLCFTVGGSALLYYQTYMNVRTIKTIDINSGNDQYAFFLDGIVKINRNGSVFLDYKGNERWNCSYQIKTPIVETSSTAIAIADKGGNDIIVLDETGIKGEIHTNLPIEKITVSGQGIVSVLLKNQANPYIVTYDAKGNMLTEIKNSFSGSGYPMDMSISEDGTTLLVSYLAVKNLTPVTEVAYYSFAEKTDDMDYKIYSKVYENMIAPTTYFANESLAVVVGDNRLIMYDVTKKPKIQKELEFDSKIKSAFYSDKYIGMIVKDDKNGGNIVSLYDVRGEKIMSEKFVGEYTHAKIDGSKVILYDGRKCCIFTKNGLHRFEGEMEKDIFEISSVFGVNKYVLINTDGMEYVRLVK